ncbi:hypothetical protein [Leyella stercorea]|uniref:hypothetical protein n=1 Tax=Leyella stercorea TaxID=363265 RepID=UPI00242C65DC|nr:hypothetical protein [Leyella stercorea]
MAAWVWQDAIPSYVCDDGGVGMARCHTLLMPYPPMYVTMAAWVWQDAIPS